LVLFSFFPFTVAVVIERARSSDFTQQLHVYDVNRSSISKIVGMSRKRGSQSAKRKIRRVTTKNLRPLNLQFLLRTKRFAENEQRYNQMK
jgi:hypothetical protein